METGCLARRAQRATIAILLAFPLASLAKNPIRNDFFAAYPGAASSLLATAPSAPSHCGVCHFDFSGGGTRNPYGAAVEARRKAGRTSAQAFADIAALDSDGDGYSNLAEITDTSTYSNTPTFPGLSAANIGSVTKVTISEISGSLTPTAGGPDTTPPSVAVTNPNGGQTLIGNAKTVITWSADDASGIAGIDLFVSLDNGSSYTPIALGLADTGTFDWFVSNRPASNALVKIKAIDNAFNEAFDTSDAVFVVISTNDFPSTLRDFDQPGSQPIVDSGLPQADPQSCGTCHGGYSAEHEPYRNWLGSMMAQASIDPIFKANMSIAQQDAPDSGDLCLRCHNSRGWLDGRSSPTDGSQMTAADQTGVSCDLCHRLVDPEYKLGISPAEDAAILGSLASAPQHPGNGMYVFDPNSHRRGPFDDTISPHTDIPSSFHREAAICGTCHDVSNPVFVRDGTNTEYVANAFDAPAGTDSPCELMPVERTYSEWAHSEYNTPDGVFAPQFAGNKAGGMVATCQDCHMPDILGHGADPAQFPTVAQRANLPLHDMTGGSTWLPNLLPGIHGLDAATATAISNGVGRAEYMLRKAARLQATQDGTDLNVMVINDTGHKLPTGYPEGRRVWINVRFYDGSDTLLAEHGGYDYATGLLTNDTRIYEVHPGIGPNLASALGMDPGPSLHFVLNNQVYEDNRIPPRGFTNSVFATFGGAPVGHHYEDGQYWDNTLYEMPEGAERAHVRLFYQSTSKEFVEFLRDENTTDENGQFLYDLWNDNGRCPPTLMAEAWWPENFSIHALGWTVDNALGIAFNSISGYTYWIEYADDLGSNLVWKPFLSNGMFEAMGASGSFTDDFTAATSGDEPASGHRFYRIRR